MHVRPDPSAEHPPLFSLLLAGFWKLGVHGYTAQKLLMCAFGAVTVALVGLAGREVAGERAGLIAAGLAALYPLLWVADGSLLAESLYGPFIAGAMLLALRFSRSPGWKPAALFGALVGLAALTRGEAVLLVVVLLIPLALTARAALRDRLRLGAVMLLATAVVIAPWTARNLSRFHDPVLISTNSNATFAGVNCDGTYHGETLGMWRLDCYSGSPRGDESQQASFYRDRGLDYARDHAGRLPVVLAARLGRAWDLYRPLQGIRYEFLEGRSRWASRLGLLLYYPTLLLAAFGVVVLRRRSAPVLPLVAFPLLVCAVAILYYGITRFRFAAEPALIVLAAVALDELLARRSDRRARDGQEQQADGRHLPVPVDSGVHQPAR
jgi:4-amino-4-deoxy-L-arabinose transferase-like glycosyltransferase